MTLPPPLTITYWLNPLPLLFRPIINWIFLGIIACAVLTGVIFSFFKMRGGMEKLVKRALGRAANLFISFGLTGLALYVLLYERVPYLSMRLWFLVWVACYGYYGWRVYKFSFIEIARRKQEKAEREKFEKWLPKKKE